MAAKLLGLRIFDDEAGRINRSLADIAGDLVVVSQFTLYADMRRGRRPGFDQAMPPAEARGLFDAFIDECRRGVPQLVTGEFGAGMAVHLTNDGPFTLLLDSDELNIHPPVSP
jgi:D-tyrosyl-tRNA(Tyr) deacylase